MINRILKLSLSLLTILSLNDAVAYSLKNNANVAQPLSSIVPLVEKTDLYVLFNNSESAQQNLLLNVKKNVGSNLDKEINIYYKDKSYYKSAVKIQKVLLDARIHRNKIHLLKAKNAIYPLYVEVQELAGNTYPCRARIGEQIIYRPQQPCATNNNNNVQLKN
ncbi:pilus assembly protein RcpB [Bisgaardia hudsonensis]|uniref:Pilus assembly protein RcpB n=1 Tax=Bisgaardia hudsonensis TaxID=109472 RepID=A0A4R2MUN2_9PAST|nr:hypothetical protein [Bisgaardia hudsonensis]QLB12353.1 hypothetical protein A6A11_01345 [Bisgaardia hudsonensis]TCP12402.1 pilus assembly protein RcpB [Bisgaardia hudsonensis]